MGHVDNTDLDHLLRVAAVNIDMATIHTETARGTVSMDSLLPGDVVMTDDDGPVFIVGPVTHTYAGVFGFNGHGVHGLLTISMNGDDGIDRIIFIKNFNRIDGVPSGPEAWLG